MLRVIGAAADHRSKVKSRKSTLEFVPDAVHARRLGREGTASVLALEQKPLVRKPRAVGGRDVPNAAHVLPSDRLPRSPGVIAGDVVLRNRHLIFGGEPRLRQPMLENGDEQTQAEKCRDEPAYWTPGGAQPDAGGGEHRRHDQRESPHRGPSSGARSMARTRARTNRDAQTRPTTSIPESTASPA